MLASRRAAPTPRRVAGTRTLHTVPMGHAKVLRVGKADQLHSGALTICSVFVGSVRQGGRRVATVMAHRGGESREAFLRNLRAALEDADVQGAFEIVPIALQTAPSTRVPLGAPDLGITGHHEDTFDELIANLAAEFSLDAVSLLQMGAVGPGLDALSSHCTANISDDGDVEVPPRKGMFDSCTLF